MKYPASGIFIEAIFSNSNDGKYQRNRLSENYANQILTAYFIVAAVRKLLDLCDLQDKFEKIKL